MRIFEHRHHAQAEQVHFNDAEIGAIFFVPLHDDAIGHGRRFKRNHGIELSLADDHAAGMLAQMARQILHRGAEFEILAQTWMTQIEPGIVKAVIEVSLASLYSQVATAAETLSSVSGSNPKAFAHLARAMRLR